MKVTNVLTLKEYIFWAKASGDPKGQNMSASWGHHTTNQDMFIVMYHIRNWKESTWYLYIKNNNYWGCIKIVPFAKEYDKCKPHIYKRKILYIWNRLLYCSIVGVYKQNSYLNDM